MNDMGMPYFMENEEWYYYDKKEEIYKLTKKAPKKARESYRILYSEDDVYDGDI